MMPRMVRRPNARVRTWRTAFMISWLFMVLSCCAASAQSRHGVDHCDEKSGGEAGDDAELDRHAIVGDGPPRMLAGVFHGHDCPAASLESAITAASTARRTSSIFGSDR